MLEKFGNELAVPRIEIRKLTPRYCREAQNSTGVVRSNSAKLQYGGEIKPAMWKWLVLVGVVGISAYGAYGAYDFHMAGYHTRPAMPKDAFSISYKNGLRAILVDVPNEQATRRYFGFPSDVPYYIEDAWSFCRPPTAEQQSQANEFLDERDMPGERFEAICTVMADDDLVVRGVITSVPKL